MSDIVSNFVDRKPVAYRSPLTSEEQNAFRDAVAATVSSLTAAVNSMNAEVKKGFNILQNENQFLRRSIDSLQARLAYNEAIQGRNGNRVSRFVDFSNTSGITFPNGLDDSKSAFMLSEFGEVTLPPIAIENKFYNISISNGRIVTPSNLTYTVRGSFDKGEGEGFQNYEKGGEILEGTPENAFNGVNSSYWVRKVRFPIDSKVDEVECELIVVVPESVSSLANLIEVYPFPNGSVDILELSTASDLGSNYTLVNGFVSTNNLVARRYHFPSTTVQQIKIRLRQRNWVEEDGMKVFNYGLQELSMKLVDYDKSYTPNAAFGSNNSFIVKIDAPSGFNFGSLYRFDPNPNFTLEDASNRHVRVRLGVNSSINQGIFWDSTTNVLPQNLNLPLVVNSSSIYAFVEMNYVESSGGVLSPYTVGTTPYLWGLGLSYTLLEQ